MKRSWVDSFGPNLVSEVLVEPLECYSMQDPLIAGLTSELKRESHRERMDAFDHVAALGHCLAARVLLVLAERHKPRTAAKRQLGDATLHRVTDYIEAHLGEKITAMLAREARLSPNHFSVLFKATLGVTPEQYVLRARLLRAKALIETGSYTVNQVAYMTGFSDHSHLTVQFKRQFGVPPRAYLPRIRTT
ncbi:AraC family transcriptional regulator [Termitidicoccus mucosus]|uniref:AraC family transcriptional regulator n=1 Tax=Termitidicoccus mucosus TaxID=1184151 RepID=UPI00318431D9